MEKGYSTENKINEVLNWQPFNSKNVYISIIKKRMCQKRKKKLKAMCTIRKINQNTSFGGECICKLLIKGGTIAVVLSK